MILLDTNVISEFMRFPMADDVAAWVVCQDTDELWTTAINVFEIRAGLSRMPDGRRRRGLEGAFDVLMEELGNRVAPLDSSATDAAGNLAAMRERLGQTVDFRDVMIGGIAIARNATIATRNVRHFSGFGVRVDNPWRNV